MIIAFHRPPCPECTALTTLAQIIPGPSGFDIRTFKCPACNCFHQRLVALGDPMKSPEIAGVAPWRIASGKLRPHSRPTKGERP
jgi:hypothetical protein